MVDISQGATLRNQELVQLFGVSNTGGIRRNTRENYLVLIAEYTRSIYHDRWINGTFHYFE